MIVSYHYLTLFSSSFLFYFWGNFLFSYQKQLLLDHCWQISFYTVYQKRCVLHIKPIEFHRPEPLRCLLFNYFPFSCQYLKRKVTLKLYHHSLTPTVFYQLTSNSYEDLELKLCQIIICKYCNFSIFVRSLALNGEVSQIYW